MQGLLMQTARLIEFLFIASHVCSKLLSDPCANVVPLALTGDGREVAEWIVGRDPTLTVRAASADLCTRTVH